MRICREKSENSQKTRKNQSLFRSSWKSMMTSGFQAPQLHTLPMCAVTKLGLMQAFTRTLAFRMERSILPPEHQRGREGARGRGGGGVQEGRSNQREIEWEYSWCVLLCSFPGNTIKARSQSLSAVRPPSLSPLSPPPPHLLLLSNLIPKQRLHPPLPLLSLTWRKCADTDWCCSSFPDRHNKCPASLW